MYPREKGGSFPFLFSSKKRAILALNRFCRKTIFPKHFLLQACPLFHTCSALRTEQKQGGDDGLQG